MSPHVNHDHESSMATSAPEERTVVDLYRTPAAFRRALMDWLKQASQTSRFGTTQLLAQFVYDRFLARVIGGDPHTWVLKGGTSLLPRLSHARHTKDIYLWFTEDLDDAEHRLIELASVDLGDYISFVATTKGAFVGKGDIAGRRFHIDAALGDKPLYRFTVDVVTGVAMTGTPEDVPSLAPIQIPGITTITYPAYPISDHIADKLSGVMAVQTDGRPSSRYRDLVDLILIAHERSVEATALQIGRAHV